MDLGRDDWLALHLEGQSRQPGLCGLNNPGRSVKRAKFSEAQKSGRCKETGLAWLAVVFRRCGPFLLLLVAGVS